MRNIFDLKYTAELGDVHRNIPRGQEYHSISPFRRGALSYEEAVFLYGLIIGTKPSVVIETGCENGASTIHIAQALLDQGSGKAITIEHNKNFAENCTKNLIERGLAGFVSVMLTDSLSFLSEYKVDPSERYLFFLDTDITIRPKEFDIIKEKFPSGTVIAIHDTSPNHPIRDMQLEEKTSGQPWFHLQSPRGLSITTL